MKNISILFRIHRYDIHNIVFNKKVDTNKI
jgi:hypothetical protein